MFERTKCFTMFGQMFDFVQILLNAIQHGQTRCPNGKMAGQQTVLDRVIFSPRFFFNLNFAPYLQSTLLIDRV